MLSKRWVFLVIEIFSAGLGAGVGLLFIGQMGAVVGASLGALLDWLLKVFLEDFSERSKLKRKILATLSESSSMAVRDLIQEHGLEVPTDCFTYDDDLPYIKALKKYRQALAELELENRIVGRVDVSYGLVNPPNEWVNELSGRTYKKINW